MRRHLRPLPLPLLLGACTVSAPAPWVLPPDDPLPLDPAVEARVDELLGQMTLAEKISQLHGSSVIRGPRDTWDSPDVERLGLPGLRMIDGPRGVNTGNPTLFPVAMARAASFDPELEREVGAAIALEAKAVGAHVLLAPAMNLLMHPAYGRAQEGYGEDPLLVERMAVASVQGIQTHLMASPKHLAANNIEDSRFVVDAVLDERTLREVYLPHFRAVVREAGAATIMAAYNQLNGAYCAENRELLTTILKEEWGFQGLVESDWVAATYDAKRSIEAGLDVEMPSPKVYTDLPGLVAEGLVSEDLIDGAARRVLRNKLTWGVDAWEEADPEVIASPEHAALARRAAVEGTVLLKNEGDLLPLDEAALAKVAVVGAFAGEPSRGDVGSSDVTGPYLISAVDGLTAALGAERVVALPRDALLSDDVSVLGTVDVAVVVVGLDAYDEGENVPGRPGGDRETLALSQEHQDLIALVADRAPATIVVLQGGSAITVEGWLEGATALLQTFYAGQEGGHALADVLLGEAAPGGRLPFAVPVAEADLPAFDATSERVEYAYLHGQRHLDATGTAARFPFGFGLNTVPLETSVSLVSQQVTGPDGALAVEVLVENLGDRDASEVVQVYVGPEDRALGLPLRALGAFAKVRVPAGEDARATLYVPAARLTTWDAEAHAFVLTPGTWTIAVGTSATDFVYESTFEVR